MFRHEHAHKLDDPERQRWLPIAPVIERLTLRPGMRVADVGAGTGYFALPVARAVAPGGEVFAVDVQPEMLERLRERIEPGTSLRLVRGEAAHTTLDAESVDRVLLANVWHELDDREGVLAETARVLRPGGRAAILDWRPDVEPLLGPPLEHRVADREVRAMMEAGGWRLEAPEPAGLFSYLLLATRP